jgi:hypothetical protein
MSFTVTATGSNSSGGVYIFGVALQVLVLTGASSVQPGAAAENAGFVDGNNLSITPQASGSVVYGAVAQYVSPTPYDSNTTFLTGSPWSSSGDSVYGAFFRSTSTTTASTPVTLGAPAHSGSADSVLCEILASGTISEDASSPPLVVYSGSAELSVAISTASFSPPPDCLLLAFAFADDSGDNTNTSAAITDSSGLGLNWVQQVPVEYYDGQLSVWTAVMSSADPTLAASQTIVLTADTEVHLTSADTRYNP